MVWEADEQGCRKGPWTPEEDKLLIEYVNHHGDGRWSSVAKTTGLKRSGKSCRLRWVNYLRPGLKRGQITPKEEAIIMELHSLWGNKWSTIARYLPGRTDNEIKNYWRTHFKKKERSNKERRKEYQKLKQEEEQHDHVGASGSGNNDVITLMEEQGMREETNNNMVYMYSSNYNWGLEDEMEQSWPEMVPPQEDAEEGLWTGLWNLDDSHLTANNNNLPNPNVQGPPFPSSSACGGGNATSYK